MNNFPYLDENTFVKTRRQFHAIAEIIGKIRETLVKPIAKNDNLWLSVTDGGFGMPAIEQLNELEVGCNPGKLVIEFAGNKNQYDSIAVNGKSRKEVCSAIKDLLSGYEVNTEIDFSQLESDRIFEIPEENATSFHTQLINYNQLIREFHKTISTGVKTQVCLWPHHFDNAFKWFSGKRIDEQDEFMGIGISNGDDMYELPYIYVTFWPSLKKTNTLEFAEGAVLHDSDWTGLILPYEEINSKKTIDGQKKIIEDFFTISFETVKRAFSKR